MEDGGERGPPTPAGQEVGERDVTVLGGERVDRGATDEQSRLKGLRPYERGQTTRVWQGVKVTNPLIRLHGPDLAERWARAAFKFLL